MEDHFTGRSPKRFYSYHPNNGTDTAAASREVGKALCLAQYPQFLPWWWVYPSDTLLWPSIFTFLSFSLHHRTSDMHHTDATFHDLHTIAINYSLYPSHHWSGTMLETSHMTYRPSCLYFPFLVSSHLPNASFHGLTIHESSHCAIGTLPYVLLYTNLVLILLIICI